jgi:hypothetical protein
MQNFPVSLGNFLVDFADIGFHIGSGAGRQGDEFDQVAGLPQKVFDLSDIGKVIFATLRRDGKISRFLDEGAGAEDAFGGGNQFGHGTPFSQYHAGENEWLMQGKVDKL